MVESSEENKCLDCRYVDEDDGTCKRFPPELILGRRAKPYSQYPPAPEYGGGCGEYKSKLDIEE